MSRRVERLGHVALRQPCEAPAPSRSALDPVPTGERPLALALSGGGHRATLVAVGAMRHLAAVGVLRNVRHVTSVSGGSVANALLASAWRDLRSESFRIEAFDELVTHPLLALVSDRSLARELAVRSWRSLLPTSSRTSLLADRLDHHLFDGARLEDLPQGCWFEINAANLTTGARFRFTRDLVGDYISGSAPTTGSGVRLAEAVAASCAVPALFAPVRFRSIPLPCSDAVGLPLLVDGGVYDNLGTDAIKPRLELPRPFCIVANAGGLLGVESALSRIPAIGPMLRSSAVMFQQISSIRSRRLFDTFTSPTNQLDGVLFSLRTSLPPTSELSQAQQRAVRSFRFENAEESPEGSDQLASTPTTLSRLDPVLAHRLIDRGAWLLGAVLAAHGPNLA